jgi:hypothetical protein
MGLRSAVYAVNRYCTLERPYFILCGPTTTALGNKRRAV